MKNSRWVFAYTCAVLFIACGPSAATAQAAGENEAANVLEEAEAGGYPTTLNQKELEKALSKLPPEKIRKFSEELQKENAVFQQRYLATPTGEREKLARAFADRKREAREALDAELKALPADRKEALAREFRLKIKKQEDAFRAKLNAMPDGPKEKKIKEFEKKIRDERTALLEKMSKLPLDARENLYREFRDSQEKKVKEFAEI